MTKVLLTIVACLGAAYFGIPFYNEQVTTGALQNAVVSVGPYKFSLSPINVSGGNILVAQLPGPAANGWYVLIGVFPSNRDGPKEQRWKCLATIRAAEFARQETYDFSTWEPDLEKFRPLKRYKYDSERDAKGALRQSGWIPAEGYGSLWFADSGCE